MSVYWVDYNKKYPIQWKLSLQSILPEIVRDIIYIWEIDGNGIHKLYLDANFFMSIYNMSMNSDSNMNMNMDSHLNGNNINNGNNTNNTTNNGINTNNNTNNATNKGDNTNNGINTNNGNNNELNRDIDSAVEVELPIYKQFIYKIDCLRKSIGRYIIHKELC